jgi:hypothetical protein
MVWVTVDMGPDLWDVEKSEVKFCYLREQNLPKLHPNIQKKGKYMQYSGVYNSGLVGHHSILKEFKQDQLNDERVNKKMLSR